jgi:tRNA A37 N6-isopentenylltransferase MiaA
MANFLFDVEQKNRLEQKGLLKRFSINCYGKQMTMEEIRSEKAKKYEELMHDRKSREYEEWFLKYNPTQKTAERKPKTTRQFVKEQPKHNRTIKRSLKPKKESEYLF